MRSAINENRRLQLMLLGLLALAGGFMLLKMTHGSGSESSTAASSGAGVAGASSGGVAATAAPVGGSASTSSSGAPTVPAAMIPGAGAPKSLLARYQHGDAVALLVVRAGGIDDALVRNAAGRLNGIPRLAVFVTRARGIARYAWLTQGVDVTDLPALVMLRPRGLSKGSPTATVSYGFRDANSVQQAAEDALYRGPTHLPYHP